jgi:hypothetical protein
MVLLQIFIFLTGATIVVITLFSAIKTFVLPRSAPDWLTRLVFNFVMRIFAFILARSRTYKFRDRIMAFYAPISLLLLVPVWLSMITIGYTGMFWGLGVTSFSDAFRLSGSSILTLGSEVAQSIPQSILMYTGAMIGLILVALLIAYLPTMYAAFARREILVNLLEVRAGSPPSALEILLRFHRIHGLDRLTEQWQAWEIWFSDVEESHTSLSALVFFRSPKPDHSWITAAAAVLDAAALTLSTVDIPNSPNAALCIRAGYLALRNISDVFNLSYDPDPHYPATPISVNREDFDHTLATLTTAGVPLKPDRDQAWLDFAGWRVNYDAPLLRLADITMAPDAPWTGKSRESHFFTSS